MSDNSESIEYYESLQKVADYYTTPDPFLQRLADFANGGTVAGIGITLFVPSGMISGFIESEQDYFRGIAELYRNAAINSSDDGELPKRADEFARLVFEARADEADEQIKAERRAYDEALTQSARWALTRHLHIQSAFYTVPGATSMQLPHVSVRLDHVTGWALGVTSWG